MTDWVVAKRGGVAKDRVGRNDRLSPVGERKRVSRQEKEGKKRQEAAKRMGKGGRNWKNETKNLVHFSICACHPCAGAMQIFSVSFQFYRMIPEGNPQASQPLS